MFTSSMSATGIVGSSFSYTVPAVGASSFTAAGLPPGLTIDLLEGVIVGTPTTAGVTISTISAYNVYGSSSATMSFTITDSGVLPSTPTLNLPVHPDQRSDHRRLQRPGSSVVFPVDVHARRSHSRIET